MKSHSWFILPLLLFLPMASNAFLDDVKVLTDNSPDVSNISDFTRSITAPYATDEQKVMMGFRSVSYTHLTLPTIYSV